MIALSFGRSSLALSGMIVRTLGRTLLCIRLVLRTSAWTFECHRNVLLARIQG